MDSIHRKILCRDSGCLYRHLESLLLQMLQEFFSSGKHPCHIYHRENLKVFLQVVGAGLYRFILGRRDYQNKFNYKFDIYDKKNGKK